MTERRPRTLAEVISDITDDIRRLRAAINSPRTRIQIESWTITEDTEGNLILRHENGTTHTFPK